MSFSFIETPISPLHIDIHGLENRGWRKKSPFYNTQSLQQESGNERAVFFKVFKGALMIVNYSFLQINSMKILQVNLNEACHGDLFLGIVGKSVNIVSCMKMALILSNVTNKFSTLDFKFKGYSLRQCHSGKLFSC